MQPPLPVVTKGLTQVALGAPQSVYNGGLNQGVVRYFDDEQRRPGLPSDIAALVDELKADRVGVHLVNLSPNDSKTVVVQAGMFGQHKFTTVKNGGGEPVQVDGKDLRVTLAPSSSAHISLGVERYVNTPTYAFPWHGNKIPVPFQ